MNASLLCALLSAFAVSSAAGVPALAAASTDGSLPADIAAIPRCTDELVKSADVTFTQNDSKRLCEKTLKVDELLNIPPTDTTTLKAMCDTVSCTAALKELYKTLPNCRYKDWPFKLSVENRLGFCGIKPESLVASGSAGAGDSTITRPPATWNATSSSGAGGSEFAPVEAPTSAPVPITTAPVPVVPTTAPKSAGSAVSTAAATAAIVVAAVAAVVL